jgi:hypothetical protein
MGVQSSKDWRRGGRSRTEHRSPRNKGGADLHGRWSAMGDGGPLLEFGPGETALRGGARGRDRCAGPDGHGREKLLLAMDRKREGGRALSLLQGCRAPWLAEGKKWRS